MIKVLVSSCSGDIKRMSRNFRSFLAASIACACPPSTKGRLCWPYSSSNSRLNLSMVSLGISCFRPFVFLQPFRMELDTARGRSGGGEEGEEVEDGAENASDAPVAPVKGG